MPALFLMLTSYAGCDHTLSVVYMVLAIGFVNFNQVGLICSQVDISPRYVAIIMGLANTAGTVAGCITPSVTGYFTNDQVGICSAIYNHSSVKIIAFCIWSGILIMCI